LHLLYVFIIPLILLVVWSKVRTSPLISKIFVHPNKKPWDYIFGQRNPYWITVSLIDGRVIGGVYQKNSFASSYPASEQLYLKIESMLSKEGDFTQPIPDSKGILIFSNQISYISLKEGAVEKDENISRKDNFWIWLIKGFFPNSPIVKSKELTVPHQTNQNNQPNPSHEHFDGYIDGYNGAKANLNLSKPPTNIPSLSPPSSSGSNGSVNSEKPNQKE
jgi:hypothetical protein